MSNYEIELQVQGSPSGELTQQVDGEPGGGSVSAREAEAWARGTRAGTAVSSDDPTYHNNSKYYAEQAHDAAESASAAYGTNLLAPTFDASQAYPAGAHVIHDGGYYVLPEGHTAGDTWAETSKTQQTVGGEVTGLKSAVSANNDRIFASHQNDIRFTTRKVPAGTQNNVKIANRIGDRAEDSNYHSFYYNVSGLSYVYIHVEGLDFNTFSYCFYNSSSFGHTTAVGNCFNGNTDGLVKVPTGATYILIVDLAGSTANGLYNFTQNALQTRIENNEILIEKCEEKESQLFYNSNNSIKVQDRLSVTTISNQAINSAGNRFENTDRNIISINIPTAYRGKRLFLIIEDLGIAEYSYCFYNSSTFSSSSAVGTPSAGNQFKFVDVPATASYVGIVSPKTKDINGLYYYSVEDNTSYLGYSLVTSPRLLNGAINSNGELTGNTWQKIVTIDELNIRKGSSIKRKSTATDSFTVYVYDYADDGTFTTSQYSNDCTFAEDHPRCRIVIMRTGSNDVMIPRKIKAQYDFNLICKDYHPNTLLYFLGCSGENGVVTDSNTPSGDAELIITPDGTTIGVDFQIAANAEKLADAYTLRHVLCLDYVILSHYHDDHYGSLSWMISHQRLYIDGAVVYAPHMYTEEELERFTGSKAEALAGQSLITSLVSTYDCELIVPENGDVTKIGDVSLVWYNCDFTDYDDPESTYYTTNYNDLSICFNLIYGTQVVNYTGDIGSQAQRKLSGILPKCNILKTEHHGWDGGNSALMPGYISNIMPELCISINGYQQAPSNTSSPACVYLEGSPMQTWCERYNVPNLLTILCGNIDVELSKDNFRLITPCTRYIRNDRNWWYTTNPNPNA